MKRNAIVLSIVALIVALMIYTGARNARKGALGVSDGGASGVQGELKGKMAPDFELESLSGKKVKLSDFKGKAVLVNFWATWCQPCNIEMPWLVDLQKQYGPQGYVTLGVSVDDGSNEKIAAFAGAMNVNYTILRSTDAVANEYGGVDGLPTSFFIDRSGKVVEQIAGLADKSEIEKAVKASLGSGVVDEPAPTPAKAKGK